MDKLEFTELDKIDALVKAAVKDARRYADLFEIDLHRKLGQSISILSDGKIVTLTAEQIPTVEERTSKPKSN
ncbi:MAG: hypothetical protein QNJ54_35780 [Prochloraceae cyanobacterium]|nr:hypothetical protein [Prochloraceae cyanobacterium]